MLGMQPCAACMQPGMHAGHVGRAIWTCGAHATAGRRAAIHTCTCMAGRPTPDCVSHATMQAAAPVESDDDSDDESDEESEDEKPAPAPKGKAAAAPAAKAAAPPAKKAKVEVRRGREHGGGDVRVCVWGGPRRLVGCGGGTCTHECMHTTAMHAGREVLLSQMCAWQMLCALTWVCAARMRLACCAAHRRLACADLAVPSPAHMAGTA